MSSSRWFKSQWLLKAGLFVVLALSIGCGIHLFEKNEKADAVSYNGKGYGCLSQIPPHISSYINDEMDEAQITTFVQCLQKSLTSFAQLTRGRSELVYEAEEIRNFLQSYFLKERIISPEFMKQFMIIKQVLVGGEIDRITRPELFDAIQLLEEVRLEAIRLKPHLRYLNSTLIEQQSSVDLGRHLNEANAALRRSLDAFSSKLQNSTKPYALSDLTKFLIEFRKFTSWEDHTVDSHPVEKWVNLLKIFKSITVSPDHPDEIQIQDWVPLLEATSNWYSSLLDFQVGIKGKPVLKGPGFQNLIYLGYQVFDHIKAALIRQPRHVITFDQIHTLLMSLHDLGWLPQKLQVESVDQALVALVTRVFSEPVEPSDLAPEEPGLKFSQLVSMEHEFEMWKETQSNLISDFGEVSLPQTNVPILQMPLPNVLNTEPKTTRNYTRDSDYDEFLKIRSLMKRPLFPEDINRVYFVPGTMPSATTSGSTKVFDRYKIQYGLYDLSVMNVLRSVVALIHRGYAQDHGSRVLWKSGIEQEELQNFYIDFRPVGVDLGMVDSRTTDAGKQAFEFAKLFTFDSTGFQWSGESGPADTMSFVETMSYFAYLYSEGELATDIYGTVTLPTAPQDSLLGLCPRGELDLYGNPKVDRACAAKMLPNLILHHATNMPFLQSFLSALAPAERQRYANLLMETVLGPCSKDEVFERNELATLVGVVHFAESLMMEYDTNGDGILNNDEVEAAVPIFKGILKKMAHEKSHIPELLLGDDFARAAFLFILSQKQMPAGFWDLLTVYNYESVQPIISVDRLKLAEVFKLLIQKLRTPPDPSKGDVCKGVTVLRKGATAYISGQLTRQLTNHISDKGTH